MSETKIAKRKLYETWYFRLGLTMLVGIVGGLTILELDKILN